MISIGALDSEFETLRGRPKAHSTIFSNMIMTGALKRWSGLGEAVMGVGRRGLTSSSAMSGRALGRVRFCRISTAAAPMPRTVPASAVLLPTRTRTMSMGQRPALPKTLEQLHEMYPTSETYTVEYR